MQIKKYNKKSKYSYCLGTTLTIELLKNKPDKATRVFIHSSYKQNETYQAIEELCHKSKTEMVFNDKAFNILSDKENCYVIGEFEKYAEEISPNESQIVLVNPSNAGNLGTIMRSTLGFGVNNIAIISPAVDIFDPKTIRSSMGAIFSVKVQYFGDISKYIEMGKNIKKYAFMLDGKIDLKEIQISKNENFCLIFGNEASGLPSSYKDFCETVVIKHSHNIDSLNLQSAVTIALYEFTKGQNKNC